MAYLKAGDVISTPAYAVIDHWGIFTEIGTVISNSKRHGKVVEEPLESFSNGGAIKRIGYLGNLPESQVVFRARARTGKKWHLVKSNCEHFAHEAHGLEKKSPQLMLVSFCALVASVAIFLKK